MKVLSVDDKARNKKLNEAFLYDMGYAHVEITCKETDDLLDEYKDLDIPQSLDTWFESYHTKVKKLMRQKTRIKQSLKLTKRVAIFLIAFLIVSATVIWNVEAFRVKFLNMMIKDEGSYTSIQAYNPDKDYSGDMKSPSYMTDVLSLDDILDQEKMMVLSYSGPGELFLNYSVSTLDFNVQLDTENAVITDITIDGHPGFIAEKGFINMYWHDDFYHYIIASNVGLDEMMKIAESVE
jgi:hypothetical protein